MEISQIENAGTLLTPDTINATDYTTTPAELARIGYRDGNKNLPTQRGHVLLHQMDLPVDGAHACWLTAPFRAAADTFPLDTPELRKKALDAFRGAWKTANETGLHKVGFGGRVSDGVDLSRRALNACMPSDRQVRSYRMSVPRFDVEDPTHQCFYAAQSMGWMVTLGRYISPSLLLDLFDDGIVQSDAKPTGSGTYGHLFCMFSRGYGLKRKASDNYPKFEGATINGFLWRNEYELDDLEVKVQNGQIFHSSYVFLPKA